MSNILYTGCQLINPFTSEISKGDVLTQAGKIIDIQPNIPAQSGTQTQAGQHLWAMFKFFDLCHRPHIRQPQGFTLEKETIAAKKNGFGFLCVPPDAASVTDSTARVKTLINGTQHANIRLFPVGAITLDLKGEKLADMTQLIDAGCIALSQAQHNIKDYGFLRQAYQYAASFNIPIIIQPQDPWLLTGIAREGKISAQYGLPGIPAIAESIAIAAQLVLIEDTGIQAHFSCLSTQKGVALIRAAKQRGLSITADVAMHSLFLTDECLKEFDSHFHVYPPLGQTNDMMALREACQDQTIDAIVSDHRPHHLMAKDQPFGDSEPGMSTIDAFLGLGLKLVEDKVLTPIELAKLTSLHAASCFHLAHCYNKKLTADDYFLLDPTKQHVLETHHLVSQGKNNPFLGWTLSGQIISH